MEERSEGLMHRNIVFLWIAAGTAALLLIPLAAMQMATAVSWAATDFIVMGVLLFGMSSLFVLVARRVPARRRVVVGGLFLLAFLYVWAELAVGVVTNLGS